MAPENNLIQKSNYFVDVSSYGIGSVLALVMSDEAEKLMSFAFRSFSKSRENYSKFS